MSHISDKKSQNESLSKGEEILSSDISALSSKLRPELKADITSDDPSVQIQKRINAQNNNLGIDDYKQNLKYIFDNCRN